MFDDILSKSHSYEKLKSLRINEIQNLLSWHIMFQFNEKIDLNVKSNDSYC